MCDEMIVRIIVVFSIFSLSRCAPKLDGKDHFDRSKFQDEFGIENLYLPPYIDVIDSVGLRARHDDGPVQLEAPVAAEVRKRESDERPYQLKGPFAEVLEKAERSLNIQRRTFYCNLVWSPLYTSNETSYKNRYQIQYKAIPYITFQNMDCDALSRTARQHCLHFAKEAFHGSVTPLSLIASQNACEYFHSTIWPRDRRRIYLVYKVDNCDRRVYRKLGDVCCWNCVGKRNRVLNPGCNGEVPDDCDVIQEQRLKGRLEKLLVH